jgi:dTDP-glucose pyrophosphorylase
MTSDYRIIQLGERATLRDAIETINNGGSEICLIVDGNGVLLGTITDGDIRRGLLRGLTMDELASQVMNTAPRTASLETDEKTLLKIITADVLRQIPLVDQIGRVVGIRHIRDLTTVAAKRPNWVVFMAGGLGERLRPLTDDTPKPLLNVGNKPLLHSILESFIEQGFVNFFISVNYHADIIKGYFGDGQRWNVNINYLEEKSRMGTAGALTLLPEKPEHPVFVMNGDLVTRVNFQSLLEYHVDQNASATMCVREYDFQVPFGVISIKNNRITAIDEKPVHRFFVNAGIYVLNPNLIEQIPQDDRTDMTQVFESAIATDLETAVFPIHEYWLDIGRIDDLEQAKSDFNNGFND